MDSRQVDRGETEGRIAGKSITEIGDCRVAVEPIWWECEERKCSNLFLDAGVLRPYYIQSPLRTEAADKRARLGPLTCPDEGRAGTLRTGYWTDEESNFGFLPKGRIHVITNQ